MGIDKASIEYDGARLVERAHARLSTVADPVLFAPGKADRLGPLPGPQVADAHPDGGPLGAVVGGLEASPHELQAIVAVDMPWCSATLFQLLADLWAGEDAVVPVDDHGPQVLHALYATSALSTLRRALEGPRRGMRDVLGDLAVRYVDESEWRGADPSGRFAVNVNRPGDLTLLGGSP